MLPDTSELLFEINKVFGQNPADETNRKFDLTSFQKGLKNSKVAFDLNKTPLLKRPRLKEITKPLEKLEDQNDQLLSIIYMLLQKICNLKGSFSTSVSITQEEEKTQEPVVQMLQDERRHTRGCDKREKPVLTKREMDVFILLEKGYCAKEIAKSLFISETTVITHKKNLKEKFQAKNTVELISKILAVTNT